MDQAADKLGKLLIVEDDTSLLFMLRDHFEDSFEVRIAEDGEAGLAQALEFVPDCIIADVRMPKMSGLSLLKRVRTIPELTYTGVVLLTQLRETADRIRGYENFADLYFSKPFDMDELKVATLGLVKMRQHLKSQAQPGLPLEHFGKGISDKDLKLLSRLTAVIEEHLQDSDLSVGFLASACKINAAELEEEVQRLEGVTPIQFVRQFRLEQAKKMLDSGEITDLETLAGAVGFKDTEYFSSLFKRQFGYLPAERLN